MCYSNSGIDILVRLSVDVTDRLDEDYRQTATEAKLPASDPIRGFSGSASGPTGGWRTTSGARQRSHRDSEKPSRLPKDPELPVKVSADHCEISSQAGSSNSFEAPNMCMLPRP